MTYIPTRPPSAYMMWLNSSRDQIKKDFSCLKAPEILKKAGEIWNSMEDKSEWEEKAAKAKEQYMKRCNASPPPSEPSPVCKSSPPRTSSPPREESPAREPSPPREASPPREPSPKPAEDADAPLAAFFGCMFEATRRLPPHAQIHIKETLFDAVIAAEEAQLAAASLQTPPL